MTTTATSTQLSTVIGVFPDYKQANKAIDELRRTNFSYDRIRLVEHGTGHFADTLKGMFSGQSAVASSTSDSLVNMGMPEYEAQYYQRELDADHVLVLMNADDRPEEAFSVMRQNGAFDINSRLRTTDLNDTNEASAPDKLEQKVPLAPSPTTSYRETAPTASNPARTADVESVDPNVPANQLDRDASMAKTDPGTPAVDLNVPDGTDNFEASTNADAVDSSARDKATSNS